MSNMDLDTAYEIAGGYKEADEKTFAQALEIVRKNDEEFAKSLKIAHEQELAFKRKQEEAEKITANPKEIAENTEFLYNELGNDDIKNSLMSDEEIRTAIDNTPIVDGKDGVEVSPEERDKHIEMLIEKAKLDVMIEQSRNRDFASKTNEEKKETLFEEVKDSFLGTLVQLRTAAQLQNNIPNAAEAVVNDDKEFFVKQQEALGNMALQDKAIDMEEKIEVSSDLVITACVESEAKAESYKKILADKALLAKGKAKDYYSRAGIFINKAKTSFVEKAKQVWGQRYEFAKNMKDKFITIEHILLALIKDDSLKRMLLFSCLDVTLRTAARQASLSFSISQSLLKFMSIESVMPSSHLILCCSLPRVILW